MNIDLDAAVEQTLIPKIRKALTSLENNVKNSFLIQPFEKKSVDIESIIGRYLQEIDTFIDTFNKSSKLYKKLTGMNGKKNKIISNIKNSDYREKTNTFFSQLTQWHSSYVKYSYLTGILNGIKSLELICTSHQDFSYLDELNQIYFNPIYQCNFLANGMFEKEFKKYFICDELKLREELSKYLSSSDIDFIFEQYLLNYVCLLDDIEVELYRKGISKYLPLIKELYFSVEK